MGVGEQGGRIFRVKEGEKEREAEVVIRREKKRVGNVIGGNHSSRKVSFRKFSRVLERFKHLRGLFPNICTSS